MRFAAHLIILLAAATAFAGEYPDVKAVDATLAELTARDGVQSAVIGRTLLGRDIRTILIGRTGPVPLAERPRLLVVAGIAADHRIGTAAALGLARTLSDAERSFDGPVDPLSLVAVEIIPLLNADALAALLEGPAREGLTNLRPLDLDRDGETDEDGPEDLNGDGVISLMRVPDAAGDQRTSLEDERLLVLADRRKGERGAYRLVLEGLDNDGDGEINEDGPGGIDLDRNFPHGWAARDLETGTSCPSEPETRALIDHVLSTPQIGCVVVYGRHDTLSGVPAANRAAGRDLPKGPPAEDLSWIHDVVRIAKTLTGTDAPAGPQATGAFHQWAYYHAGIPAFSTPLFHVTDGETPLTLASGEKPTTRDGRYLALADHLKTGFRPWTPFEHPALGPVEIGGFDPLFRVNPPADRIDPIVEDQVKFVTSLLALFPRLSLGKMTATNVGRGVYEVRATLGNDGVLPAVTAMGRHNRKPMPLRVELHLPAKDVLQGTRRELVERLDGGGTLKFRWLIRGKPGDRVTLSLHSARCGNAAVEVEL
jgi:alkylated DNA nucleotide flippase Atl1